MEYVAVPKGLYEKVKERGFRPGRPALTIA